MYDTDKEIALWHVRNASAALAREENSDVFDREAYRICLKSFQYAAKIALECGAISLSCTTRADGSVNDGSYISDDVGI